MAEWKKHVYRVGAAHGEFDEAPTDSEKLRKDIEPWLSAVFQSEHLSLFVGSGLTSAIAKTAGANAADMGKIEFGRPYEDKVNKWATESAIKTGRGSPNIEDQLRAALQLIAGLEVIESNRLSGWKKALDTALSKFLQSILKTERDVASAIANETQEGLKAETLLKSFLLSFASRAASRERLHIFTTNYDRLIEYASDMIGLRVIDRFVGHLSPIFRSSRVDIDFHYNPPGIRGEPRYLEGVVKLTKLHGSIDWRLAEKSLRRFAVPFGAETSHPGLPKDPANSVMIYPNPAKDMETSEFPYAELFRDFASALCRPNSVVVTYGYGFGDDHINRVIADMLTIPSTHLVIMSYDDASGRIPRFCERIGRPAQISLLVGAHFGDLSTLVENYLPKPAIDQITWRRADLVKKRGEGFPEHSPEATPASTTEEK